MKKFRIITVLVVISFMVATNVNAQFRSKAVQVVKFVVPSGSYAGEVFIIKPGEDINDLFASSGTTSAYMNKQELVTAIASESGLTTAKLIVTTPSRLSSLMKGSFSTTEYILYFEDGTNCEVIPLNIEKSGVGVKSSKKEQDKPVKKYRHYEPEQRKTITGIVGSI